MSKKFGTFAGVFTPSLLTILGVIMYLRLGWVVGQAGLYSAIGLILLAHVISISTGLSLSSIATDKKIKTGGIYFMLSRSLGLPIGGAIGITLFIGTAFSIALYIVGFVENFLSIEAISVFLGMTGTINDIRIIGSIVIISLVILAYISTSFAIKTQFFILGAIALSLLSIFIGLFIHPDIQSITPNLTPAKEAPELIVIFAIFFPAVTGFTAGVTMSGDLKSPKNSIPVGTLAAIGVGFVVYIALAIVFALFVDRNLLINDTNFLIKIAWFSPLVIAGIWGATLSSAFRGILGAPRILQAMSIDRITPKIFSRGTGKNNEPRQALIATFIIAEIGILIGDLDAIAAIVSMFYIAAYGFINLAYALESWANSDFRPSLRIPKWIGILGFIASMGVMFKLDTLAMGISLIILFGIYILLKRREIQGSSSNVWQSVWTTIVRSRLHKISQNPENEKNWVPNIILFSGGTNSRTHLFDLGTSFVGDHGYLSNFDLQVKKEDGLLFSKKEQNINSELSDKYPGVYTRKQSVSNIYEGIEVIAQTYGFSGIEPNTVMMGWARQSAEPTRFVKSINNLIELDMNVLLVDYDAKRGFGKYKLIDIWWRGGSKNGNLALYFSKFLLNSEQWSGAQIRLLIVNDQTELTASIYQSGKEILENLRIQAELVVIENEIAQKSFYEIIQKESFHSDLTFLGFPELEIGNEFEFVEKTNKLCKDIGTVILIKSASIFKELHLGNQESNDSISFSQSSLQNEIPLQSSIKIPSEASLGKEFQKFSKQLQHLHASFIQSRIEEIKQVHSELIQQLNTSVNHSFQNLSNRLSSNLNFLSYQKIITAQHSLFMRAQSLGLNEINDSVLSDYSIKLSSSINEYISSLEKITNHVPPRIKILRTKASIKAITHPDELTLKTIKRLKPLWIIAPKFPYYVNFQGLVDTHFPHKIYESLNQTLIEFDQLNFKIGNHFGHSLQKISDLFEHLKNQTQADHLPTKKDLSEKLEQALHFITELSKSLEDGLFQIENHSLKNVNTQLESFSDQLDRIFPNAYENHEIDYYVQSKALKRQITAFPEDFYHNFYLVVNQNLLNSGLLQLNQQLKMLLFQEKNDLLNTIEEDSLRSILNLKKSLVNLKTKKQADLQNVKELFKSFKPNTEYSISQILLDINDARGQKFKAATSIFPEKLELYTEHQKSKDETFRIHVLQGVQASISRTIDYLVEKEASNELRDFLFKFGPELQSLKNDYLKLIQQLSLFDKEQINKDGKLDWESFIDVSIDQLEALANNLLKKKVELSNFFDSIDLKLKKSLNLHAFIANLTNLKQYIRVHSQKKKFEKFTHQFKIINGFLERQLNKLWYNQSSGLLLARKLSKAMLKKDTRVYDLLLLKDQVGISETILDQLPDYYKQLFLKRHFYLKDFWVGRDAEFSAALKSFEHYKNGFLGGMMVLGERRSGKSFFLNQLIPKLNIKGDVFQISSPYAGSTSPSDLLLSFNAATEKTGTFTDILNAIPAESILVIDNLELWWEKSQNGMRTIDQLMKLVRNFSHRHLFIFACDINAFQLINHYRKIESNFINLIELAPMNAKEIKEAILKRHLSSGLKFQYKNRDNTNFKSWHYAMLYSSYFNYSEGNIGVALQTWMANIKKVENNTLTIQKPVLPDQSIFNYLETDWMIFIMQFILHKRMNIKKLARILRESEVTIQNKVDILKRAGIVNSLTDGLLELNPYMLPFLQKALIKRQLF
ncbi:MAG: hypothetical protein JW729_09255 [Bacteroidales bacterium]|nr:hypothetical protein [Bacteroidales bacterium]